MLGGEIDPGIQVPHQSIFMMKKPRNKLWLGSIKLLTGCLTFVTGADVVEASEDSAGVCLIYRRFVWHRNGSKMELCCSLTKADDTLSFHSLTTGNA